MPRGVAQLRGERSTGDLFARIGAFLAEQRTLIWLDTEPDAGPGCLPPNRVTGGKEHRQQPVRRRGEADGDGANLPTCPVPQLHVASRILQQPAKGGGYRLE